MGKISYLSASVAFIISVSGYSQALSHDECGCESVLRYTGQNVSVDVKMYSYMRDFLRDYSRLYSGGSTFSISGSYKKATKKLGLGGGSSCQTYENVREYVKEHEDEFKFEETVTKTASEQALAAWTECLELCKGVFSYNIKDSGPFVALNIKHLGGEGIKLTDIVYMGFKEVKFNSTGISKIIESGSYYDSLYVHPGQSASIRFTRTVDENGSSPAGYVLITSDKPNGTIAFDVGPDDYYERTSAQDLELRVAALRSELNRIEATKSNIIPDHTSEWQRMAPGEEQTFLHGLDEVPSKYRILVSPPLASNRGMPDLDRIYIGDDIWMHYAEPSRGSKVVALDSLKITVRAGKRALLDAWGMYADAKDPKTNNEQSHLESTSVFDSGDYSGYEYGFVQVQVWR